LFAGGRAFSESRIVQFALIHPLPGDVKVEIQTSTYLGETDPWRTHASKFGTGTWFGSAAVNESPHAGGKVIATLTSPQLPSGTSRQFYRFRLSAE
jgi:hypothetical protein